MLSYCAALDAHNDRTWFHENHKWYEDAKRDYLGLLDYLRFPIMQASPSIADDIMFADPKDWMYRVARDMRYHRDGPPYNPALRAYISRDRKSNKPIGYFIRIFPGSSCIGTGLWYEKTKNINKVRDYIIDNYDEFTDILENMECSLNGDSLKNMPRGYSEDEEAAEWIKLKNWQLISDIPDSRLTTYEDLADYVESVVRDMEPMRKFLMNASNSVV